MIQFVCSCLNIRIHAKGSLPELENPKSLSLPEAVICDPFFESQVYQIVLDLAGVTVSQKGLCKSRHIENWIITSCACCMTDMFAKRIDDHVSAYVSSKSETRTNFISSLLESECYSSLFKLVLPEINDNFIQNNLGIEFQNGNIDHSIELVQHQVSSYLEDEQRAMDERIRLFTEEQQSNYALLLKNVRKHKQAMIYLMIKCKESQNKSIDEPVTSSTSSPLSQDLATESSSSTDSAFIRSNSSDHPPLEKVQRKSQSLKTSKTKKDSKKRSSSLKPFDDIDFPTNECLFDMEEFDSNNVFSSNSDDESDELEVDDSIDLAPEIPDSQLMCASSLPVSIPSFSRPSHFPVPDDDEKDDVPVDIAASMRALACSVQDGTEMFGELPRRRLNTGELLAFRPF